MNLADEVRNGNTRAASRLMSLLEAGDSEAMKAMGCLFSCTGRAWVIGITGFPGTGKSTLVARLITRFRGEGYQVGVIAVDNSSPLSGGAILGDRIRMLEHSLDEGVFIRSMATRGHLGGLAVATRDAVLVLDALGCQVVLVETVGVGQDGVEIADLAETVVVVVAPGLGDEIQALKAGIMEIGHLFVINKADRPGADEAQTALQEALTAAPGAGSPPAWIPVVQQVSALRDEGLDRLLASLMDHRRFLEQAHGHASRPLSLRERTLQALFDRLVARRGRARLEQNGRWKEGLTRLREGDRDPYTAAEELVRELSL